MSDRYARSRIEILFVQAHPDDAERIDRILCAAHQAQFVITRVERVEDATEGAETPRFDLILLDLFRSVQDGPTLIRRVRSELPGLPIVVLAGEAERHGADAVAAGACDFVHRDSLDGEQLPRALKYALTRHWMQANVQATSLMDELTGLKNERGLLLMAEQQRKIAQRTGREFLLLAVSLDRIACVGAAASDREHDRALIDVAQILRKTFRGTDVIARTGGNEFAVALLDTQPEWSGGFVARLEQNVANHNAEAQRPYELKIRIGIANYRSDDPSSIDSLLATAQTAPCAPNVVKSLAALEAVAA